ncbi:MAG: divalent-cation tolerance protein CutA [Burkholderiaceae bacterium]|nr:divalent-cation tolerance protein CutA [Burkholderiaceae bacterium]
MMRPDDLVLVLSNAPDMLLAKRFAHELVEQGLAACVNLGTPALSIYAWKGALESAEEVPLTIKTTFARQDEVMKQLARLHPYDVPEVLVLPVIGSTVDYPDWVRAQTHVKPQEN